MTSTTSAPLLTQLLEIPVANRDDAWEVEFLRELPKNPVRILEETPVAGPDGWPYLLISVDGKEPQSEDEVEPFVAVARWLASRGVGFVVNPQKSMPDFVMSYGMVWNFRERGEFLTPAPVAKNGGLEIQHGQQLFTGAPSRAYLPEDVRAILREFLKGQKVFDAQVLMISTDQQTWDLAFSIESMGSPPASEHKGIAEAISWFLPAHYSVALVSEKNVPGFAAL